MKKLFSSAVSLAIAFSFVWGNGIISGYATSLSTADINVGDDYEELYLGDTEDESLTLSELPSIQSNDSSSAYNYCNFIDENNLAVYDALSVWTTPSLEPITITLPEVVTVSLSSNPGDSVNFTEEDQTAYREAIYSCFKPGLDSLLFDMPEIFWIDTGAISISTNTSISYSKTTKKYTAKISVLKFTPALLSAYDSVDKAMLYKEKLETAIDTFNVSGETRYEQIMDIHDAISLFTFYDSNATYSSSAIGALVEPGVVCEGYAKGFKLICDKMDIPCVLVFGNYDQTTQVAHMWNSVQMDDGKWYGIDVTWDDIDGASGAEVKYQYFLKGSTDFFKTHTEESNYIGTIFTYPELASDDYSVQYSVTTTVTETTTTITETTTTTEVTPIETETTTTTEETPIETETTTTTEETPIETETTTTTEVTQIETETTTTTEIIYERGDFNCDGKVNVADLVICLKSVLGERTGYFCDYNEDGVVDSFDIVAMRKYFVSKA